MKCIRRKDKVVRVTNEQAAKEVGEGKATYVPKHVWKEETRDKNS